MGASGNCFFDVNQLVVLGQGCNIGFGHFGEYGPDRLGCKKIASRYTANYSSADAGGYSFAMDYRIVRQFFKEVYDYPVL